MYSPILKSKFRFLSLCILPILFANCNPFDSRVVSEQDEYAWLPNALLFEKKDKTVVVGIKRHGDVYFYNERHGASNKAMESVYYLESYDAATMRRTAQKKISPNDDEKNSPTPQIIGKGTEKIWIFTDQLTAYHCSTLEQVVNRKKIEQRNPGLKNMLLTEAKYYRWDKDNKAIIITTVNGNVWQLNPETLEALPYTPSTVYTDKHAERKKKSTEDRWRSGSELALKTSQDTIANTFIGLYSAEELPVYANVFRNDPASSLDALRNLWIAPYKKSSSKITGIKIMMDVKAMKPLSDKTYLNGFFLTDRTTYGTFHCAKPSGYIIAYKNKIGNDAHIVLSRVATDGKEIWNIETDIKEIKGLDFTDRYLLLQATNDDPSNFIDKMYSIRLADGKMTATKL